MVNPETVEAPAAEEKKPLNLEVSIDKVGTCKRHVTVTIPREEIERYFRDAFDDLAPRAEVPGFRPGRAPRKLVEKNFREQMKNQVKGSLLLDSVSQIADSDQFSAIGEPELDMEAIEMPSDGPLTFEFDIEVRPDFDLPEWKGLKLDRPAHEYSDDEVDLQLRRLLRRYGKETVDADAAVGPDDSVEINLTFRDGDEVVARIPGPMVAVKRVLSTPDGNIEGFDELVLGKRAGDRAEGKMKVSDVSQSEALRGKELTVEVEVVEVRHVELPDLNPTFLDEIGGFADETELKDAVRGELERQLAFRQQRELRDQITKQLTKDANWDLPEDLLRRQWRRELNRMMLELQSTGFSNDQIRQYANALSQQSQAATASSLKEHFIFERIAENEKIEATDGDYDQEVRAIAASSNESARRVRARLEKRGQMDALRNQIIERKVVDLITSHAQISEKPLEQQKDDTVAIDTGLAGESLDSDIPEAKYGADAEQLPGQPGTK